MSSPIEPLNDSPAPVTADDWKTPTGRMIWLGHPDDSPFESKAVPEMVAHAKYPVTGQAGTYFKSTQTHNGMTVWWWGGVHPVDFAAGWYCMSEPPAGFDRWGRVIADA